MIIAQLSGGLGNQMFQYAAAYALAVHLDVPLRLDLSEFANHPLRSYRLDHFCIECRRILPVAVRFLTRNHGERHLERLMGAVIHRVCPGSRHSIVTEPHFHYYSGFLQVGPNSHLVGYWQSHRYFQKVEGMVRQQYRLRRLLSDASAQIAQRIRSRSTVAVHIRRGDYVADPAQFAVHGACGSDYYVDAVAKIQAEFGSVQFAVFSDDIRWVRTNLDFLSPAIFVDHNGPARDYEDMALMALCDHHIIANSSFSWWGAWLAARPGQRVIAPARWFAHSEHDTSDLCPPTWLRL